MKIFHQPSLHALMLAAAMAVAAAPAMAAQSSAYAVSAYLATDGHSPVQLPPQLPTSGETVLGQSYDDPLSAPLLSKNLRLLPAAARSPVLAVLEQKVQTDAAGSNGVDALNTTGTSKAAAGIVALTLYPSLQIDPPKALPQPNAAASLLPALRVQFSKLKATASYAQVFPRPSLRSGSTSFGEVMLSGPLVGGPALTFSGEIKPNTVVVNTPTVKITLNAQVIPQQPVCPPNMLCPLYRVLETVETQAVLIELTNASVFGHEVSGEIVIGDAQAGQ